MLNFVSTKSLEAHNSFLTNSGYHVANANAWTVMAEGNYWNSATSPCFPKSSKIIGPVDYNPSLCSNPNPTSPMPGRLPDPTEPLTPRIVSTTPNPFNPTITIGFAVPPAGAYVALAVYDVQGMVVRTLFSGHKPGGLHDVSWDGSNEDGEPLASAVYFVRMLSDRTRDSRKIVLLK